MVPFTTSYNLSSVFRNCPSLRFQLLETMVAVDMSPKKKKIKLREGRPSLLFAAEALQHWHKSLHGAEKNYATQPHAVPLLHHIKVMESDIHNFCCFCTASVRHVWVHGLNKNA